MLEKKLYGIVENENHVYLYNLPKPKKFISEDGEILWVKGDFCGSYIAREEDNLKIGDMVEIIIKKISQNHE